MMMSRKAPPPTIIKPLIYRTCGMCRASMEESERFLCPACYEKIFTPCICGRCGRRVESVNRGICIRCSRELLVIDSKTAVVEKKKKRSFAKIKNLEAKRERIKRMREEIEYAVAFRLKPCVICETLCYPIRHHLVYKDEGPEEIVKICKLCHGYQPKGNATPAERKEFFELCYAEFHSPKSFPKSSP